VEYFRHRERLNPRRVACGKAIYGDANDHNVLVISILAQRENGVSFPIM
jgi:hypothetical protein